MSPQEVADAIVAYVNDKGDATHGSLIYALGETVALGEAKVSIPTINVVLMVGASQVLAEAVNLLWAETPRRVEITTTCGLVAMVDGCPTPTKMKWVGDKGPPKGGYKKPRFAPILLVRLKHG